MAFDELVVRGPGIETPPEEQRLGEHEHRHDQSRSADERRTALLVPDEQQRQRADDRQHHEGTENRERHRATATGSSRA
jgi:hypothetical protein